MDTEKSEFIAQTLRGLNLKLVAVKEASTKLLTYTSEDNSALFIRVWEQVFHEKRNSERERIGLFFVVHELLYRSNNTKFKEAFYEVLYSCVAQISGSEHTKLKQEVAKLIKLWTDNKIYDSQKIIRMTILLNLEDQSKDELILSQLPENLPNPPSELIAFSQNLKELKRFSSKVKENQQNLEQLYEGIQNSAITPGIKEEVNTNLQQLKRNLELENKYRGFALKSYKEVLNLVDKQHMKSVIELKLFLQKVDKLQFIRDNIELP